MKLCKSGRAVSPITYERFYSPIDFSEVLRHTSKGPTAAAIFGLSALGRGRLALG